MKKRKRRYPGRLLRDLDSEFWKALRLVGPGDYCIEIPVHVARRLYRRLDRELNGVR